MTTVAGCVAEMDEDPLDLVEYFQFELELLADVVRLSDAHRLRQDDVDLDEVLAAEVERLDVVDGHDAFVVVHHQPRDQVDEFFRCRETGYQADLFCEKKTENVCYSIALRALTKTCQRSVHVLNGFVISKYYASGMNIRQFATTLVAI